MNLDEELEYRLNLFNAEQKAKARQLIIDYINDCQDCVALRNLLRTFEAYHHIGAAWGTCLCQTCKDAYILLREIKEEINDRDKGSTEQQHSPSGTEEPER